MITVTGFGEPLSSTLAPAPTSTREVGVLLIIYYNSHDVPLATATVTSTGASGTQTSSVLVSTTPSATATATSNVVSSSEDPGASGIVSTSELIGTVSASISTSPTSVVTASGARVTGGLRWLISSVFIAVLYLR